RSPMPPNTERAINIPLNRLLANTARATGACSATQRHGIYPGLTGIFRAMNGAIAPLIVVARRPHSPPATGGCHDPEACRAANAASQLRPSKKRLGLNAAAANLARP